MRPVIRAVASLMASLLLLTGCSALPLLAPLMGPSGQTATPASGKQSLAQACSAIYDNREFSDALGALDSDVAKARNSKAQATAVESFRKVLAKITPDLTNKSVKAQAGKLLKALKATIKTLRSEKTTLAWLKSLNRNIKKMQTEADALDALCLKV